VPDAREKTAVEAGVGTILVVEDDPDVRRSVLMLLEMLGYDTREAGNGVAALELLERDAGIDLLFTDMVMPGGMGGLELAREAVRRHGKLKVLMTSGYPEKALEKAGHSGSRFALLGKPYSNTELHQAIRSILAA
jgi:CheY-like chemotaxis protein